eukprot:jgi/Ulvmu1/11929/UM082_0008.1
MLQLDVWVGLQCILRRPAQTDSHQDTECVRAWLRTYADNMMSRSVPILLVYNCISGRCYAPIATGIGHAGRRWAEPAIPLVRNRKKAWRIYLPCQCMVTTSRAFLSIIELVVARNTNIACLLINPGHFRPLQGLMGMLSAQSVATVTVAVLALCGQAVGTKSGSNFHGGSVSKCDIRAVSKSSALSVSVAERAVKKVDAVLCGPEEEVTEHASSSAHAIAYSFAEAIAEVAADCYAKGHASFQVRGKSVALAQATAIAQAYAAAYATAHTCHKCSAASDILVESYEKIFLKATSEVHFQLEAVANGTEVTKASEVFAESLVNTTVIAFAEAIVDARAASDSCEVSSKAEVQTGDVEDRNNASCKVGAVAASDEKISNGGVAIATSVSSKACGKGFADATFEVEAKALGKVMSIAVTEISARCVVKGKGSACVLGEADITKTAEAVATAFASGFAKATNECGHLCESNTTKVSEAIGYVLATATSAIYDKQCTGNDSYFDINALDQEIVNASTAALASILTNVSVTTTGECHIEVIVDTDVTPTPHNTEHSHSRPRYPARKPTTSPKQPDPSTQPKLPPQSSDHHSAPKSTPNKTSRPSRPRPPVKHIKGYRVRQGSVRNSKSDSHHSHHKPHIPKGVHRRGIPAKGSSRKVGKHKQMPKTPKKMFKSMARASRRHQKSVVRKPKKMVKFMARVAERRDSGQPVAMRVRALIHQGRRAAWKLLAKRQAKHSGRGIRKRQHRKSHRPHQGRQRARQARSTHSRRHRQPRRMRSPRLGRRNRKVNA